MINLYKRGNYYHYSFSFNGKRFRGSTNADNKTLAIKYARKVHEDIYNGRIGISQQITLEEFIKIHVVRTRSNLSSRLGY